MAYEKQTWQTGDVITQEKLNHMEDGIAGAGGDVVIIDAKAVLNDTTWEVTEFGSSYNELKELILAKKYIVVRLEREEPYAPYAKLAFLHLDSINQAEFPSGVENSVISFQDVKVMYTYEIKVSIWNLYVHDDDSIYLGFTTNS